MTNFKISFIKQKPGRFKFFLLVVFLVINSLYAQNFIQKQYSIEDGLSDSYIFLSFQDNQGFLWSLTPKGVTKFDGQRFVTYNLPLNEGDFVNSAAATQEKIWFGTFTGKLFTYNRFSDNFIRYTDSINGSVNKIVVMPDGSSVFFMSKGSGIYTFRNNKIVQVPGSDLYQVNTILPFDYNSLLAATSDGIMNINKNNLSIAPVKGLKEEVTQLQNLGKNKKELLILSQARGLLQIKLNQNASEVITIQPVIKGTKLAENITSFCYEERNASLYVSTDNENLYQVILNSGNLKLLNSVKIKSATNSMLIDREGNLWISTASKGLYRLYAKEYETISFNDQPVYTITKDKKGIYYLGTDNGILTTDNNYQLIKKIETLAGNSLSKVTALYHDGKKLWIGTVDKGLFVTDSETGAVYKTEYSDNKNMTINSITGNYITDEVFVNTDQEGVYIYGSGNLKYHFSTENSLLHNNVFSTVAGKNNEVFYATHNTSFNFSHNEKLMELNIAKEGYMTDFNTFAKNSNNIIAVGTDGAGVYFMDDTTLSIMPLNKTLESPFCNALAYDKNDNLWIALRYSLYKYYPKQQVLKKVNLEQDNAWLFNKHASYTGENGDMLFGSDKNLIVVNDKNAESILPECYITQVSVFDSVISNQPGLTLKNATYDFVFDFSALSLKNSEEVTFQYILEGRDTKWSLPTQSKKIEFSNLGEGNYTFKVKAYNSDGFESKNFASFSFIIAKPFWKSPWFWLLILVLLFTAVLSIVRIRTATLIRAKIKLEKTVEEKTRELREEKQLVEAKNEIIEEQNKDITASINYAKRIQEALLPVKNIHEKFGDKIWVHYVPKDIVSGDFYWLAEKDNKLMVAACDCTGHGVPGAFMSMIGITLLNKIVIDKGEPNPDKIIYEMDLEVSKSLKQESSDVNDGMEAALLNVDLENGRFIYAGAKRPLFFFRKTDDSFVLEEYKADRYPIGGNADIKNKIFTPHHIQANPGSMLYLFSDGIVDQFNENKSARIGTKRVRELLLNIAALSLPEQKQKVAGFIENWQGTNNQTDDILVLGIRL